MVHFTILGYSEGEIAPGGFTSLTVYGYSLLRRPTLAQRIMHRHRLEQHPPSKMDRLLGRQRNLIITFCAATGIRNPTLMEEYTSLRNLVSTGALGREECRKLIEDLARGDDPAMDTTVLTLLGGCGENPVSKKMEKDALEAGVQAGILPHDAKRELIGAIGSPGSTTAGILARVALA